MIQTIGEDEFRKAFEWHGRDEQFSYEALEIIFNYYEKYEEDTGETIKLDVIAICCAITEMTAHEVRMAYDIDTTIEGEGDCADVIQYLEDHTSVIGQTDDTIIFFQF